MATSPPRALYEPDPLGALRPAVASLVGKTAKEKMQERFENIRKREAENRKASSVEVYVQERLERRLRSIPAQLDSVVRNREGSWLVGGEGHVGPPNSAEGFAASVDQNQCVHVAGTSNSKRRRHDCLAEHTGPDSPVEQQPAKALRAESASRKRQLEQSEGQSVEAELDVHVAKRVRLRSKGLVLRGTGVA